MRRSFTFDDSSENSPVKRIKLTEESDSEVKEHEESSEIAQGNINEEEQEAIDNYSVEETEEKVYDKLTHVERQIIQKALALLQRSNATDWMFDHNEYSTMTMTENSCISLDNKLVGYQIICHLFYYEDTTIVDITYLNETTHKRNIRLHWFNSELDDTLTITHEVPSWYFWNEKETQNVSINQLREDNICYCWCYFGPVRQHLDEIAWFRW